MNKKVFKKVPVEDVPMVYDIYCMIENCEIKNRDVEQAMEMYKNDILAKGSYTYACYIDGKIVASVNVYKNMQYYPTDLHAPFVHLECVMVHKNFQGKGIGTELISNVVKLVKEEGCTYIIGQTPVEAMKKIFFKAGLVERDCEDFRLNIDQPH